MLRAALQKAGGPTNGPSGPRNNAMGRFDCLHNAGAEEKRRLKTAPSTGAAQYVPFGNAKRPVRHCKTARPALQNGPYRPTAGQGRTQRRSPPTPHPRKGHTSTPYRAVHLHKNTHKIAVPIMTVLPHLWRHTPVKRVRKEPRRRTQALDKQGIDTKTRIMRQDCRFEGAIIWQNRGGNTAEKAWGSEAKSNKKGRKGCCLFAQLYVSSRFISQHTSCR